MRRMWLPRRRCGSELRADRGEGVSDLSTEDGHDGDDDGCDQSDEQSVLDRGGAALVVASHLNPVEKHGLENNKETEHVGIPPDVPTAHCGRRGSHTSTFAGRQRGYIALSSSLHRPSG